MASKEERNATNGFVMQSTYLRDAQAEAVVFF